jgi:hypothetical protein
MGRGYYVNVACFPAVPRRRAGIRLTLNSHQAHSDIENLVDEIAERLRAVKTPPHALPSGPRQEVPLAIGQI